MLSDRDRQELVGLVAKECGTVLSPDDPIFASVVMSERVLEHAASAVASRLARHLEFGQFVLRLLHLLLHLLRLLH